MNSNDIEVYSKHYSEESFWDKIIALAKKGGKSLIKKALVLFYSATDEDTPIWVKTVIYATLGYLILPLDGIPDVMPFVGFSDDLAAIVSAMKLIHNHIKPEHKQLADYRIKEWLG